MGTERNNFDKYTRNQGCSMRASITPAEMRNLIYHICGKAVMLDSDLAELYEAPNRIA